MAATKAAKPFVAVIQPGSRAAILSTSITRASLRAGLGTLAHAIRAVPIRAGKRAQARVVLRQALLHLSSNTDRARRRRRGGAAATTGRASGTLLLDEAARIT